MKQLFSSFAALLIFMSVSAHATGPGTITPEQGDEIQDQDDSFDQDDGQDQDQNQDQDQGQGQNDDASQDDGLPQQDDDLSQDDGFVNDDDSQDDGRWNEPRKGEDEIRKSPRKGGQRRKAPRQPRMETIPVRQQILGGARISLSMLLPYLPQRAGQRLVGIVVNGSSDAGMGVAFFCSSVCSPMQNIGYYINSYPIQTSGERINQFAGQWFLELRGNFWIDSIQLQFSRR